MLAKLRFAMALTPRPGGPNGEMAAAKLLDEQDWYDELAGVVISAGALITDAVGRLLLVKPNYRDHWTLPGGICEQGEPPHDGCAREVAEEIGLDRAIGRLLSVSWSQPYGPATRPSMHFIFDGGELAGGDGITLQHEELDAWKFAAAGQLPDWLPPHVVRRVTGALSARREGPVSYLAELPGGHRGG